MAQKSHSWPWILNVTTAVIILAAAGHHYWFKHRRTGEEDDDSDDDDDFDWTSSPEDSVPAFPWEPKKSETTKPKYMFRDRWGDDEQKNNPNHNPRTAADASKQLDFLASMTFANGGIRPPNCPCCY